MQSTAFLCYFLTKIEVTCFQKRPSPKQPTIANLKLQHNFSCFLLVWLLPLTGILVISLYAIFLVINIIFSFA
jgi:hypothetical protein